MDYFILCLFKKLQPRNELKDCEMLVTELERSHTGRLFIYILYDVFGKKIT